MLKSNIEYLKGIIYIAFSREKLKLGTEYQAHEKATTTTTTKVATLA